MIALLRVHEAGALEPGLNLTGEAERELGLKTEYRYLDTFPQKLRAGKGFPACRPAWISESLILP